MPGEEIAGGVGRGDRGKILLEDGGVGRGCRMEWGGRMRGDDGKDGRLEVKEVLRGEGILEWRECQRGMDYGDRRSRVAIFPGNHTMPRIPGKNSGHGTRGR